MIYILSQIFVIISYLLLGLTYLKSKRKTILTMGICSLVALEISYFLLSAYTGVAMVAIAIIRNVIFYFDEKNNRKSDKIYKKDIIILIVIYLITIILAIYTYNGIESLFSVIETILYTFSIWQKNPKVYKYFGVPTSLSCIIYHIYIKSIFGIILEGIVFISEIIGIVIDKVNNKKAKNKICNE
jgi:hypothetical protein